MKKIIYTMTAMVLLSLAVGPLFAKDKSLQRNILDTYEQVSAALVKDDLASARKAASELAQTATDQEKLAKGANELAQASDLKQARQQFTSVSQEAIKLAEGKEGYFVMTCPMAKADWLQSDKKIANPYMGQKMPGCGAIKKGRAP